MKYKLFISDFDGTLGRAPDYISKEDINAIKEYTAQGGIFVLCTGRMYKSIKKICHNYGITGLIASYQGAMIKDLETEETLFNGGLEPQVAVELIKKFLAEGVQVIADIGDNMYFQSRSEYIDLYESQNNIKGVLVDDLVATVERLNLPVSKCMAMCDENKVKELTAKCVKEFDSSKVSFNSGAYFLVECVNPACSKDFAVKKIIDYYKIPYDQVLTVGDSTNDIPLFGGDWYKVAVGDGHPDLKAIADEVTVPFDSHPVKVLLEKYCLR
jgi:Cof subfamily protein (haloacid dehalogenase superfamily)